MPAKIVTIIGARPQFIKAAPVSLQIRRSSREVLVNTGQHYDFSMAGVFFEELKLPQPDYHLGIGSGSHGDQTGRMLIEIEKVLTAERPDWVLVYGDTNSTLAGALAASKLHIPVAHVEAGLRSFNRAMPEEVNRVVTDHLSRLLFCPTDLAVSHLQKEGITTGVRRVGDVMCDAVHTFRKMARTEVLQRYNLAPSGYMLLTIHRAENTDVKERLNNILSAVMTLETPVVFPAHPRTVKYMHEYGIDVAPNSNIRLIPPVSYLEMLALEENALKIVTDSGGVQKEAYILGVPCVTCRDETEWEETLRFGRNVLAGASADAIRDALTRNVTRGWVDEVYGDGTAAMRVAEGLRQS